MIKNALAMANVLRDRIVMGMLYIFVAFVMSALATQLYFVYLEITGQDNRIREIVNHVTVTFDGTFKNSPENIWYNAEEHIYVQNVTNLVKVGKLAGNRNLEFGVKNVLEEYLQDKGYDITPEAQFYLDVDILYLDQVTTKKNISVLGKTDNAVVIRLKGTLFKEGIKQKEITVEESSSEIAMTTLVVDQGGKFNQSSLSSALKKGCDKLVTKLFEK
jgi:hypothetical protein